MIQSSIYYATMESSPLKCQVHDCPVVFFTADSTKNDSGRPGWVPTRRHYTCINVILQGTPKIYSLKKFQPFELKIIDCIFIQETQVVGAFLKCYPCPFKRA